MADDIKLTEKQKLEMYKANCVCCLLAVNMRNCQTCPFNVGREERVKTLEVLSQKNSLLLQII